MTLPVRRRVIVRGEVQGVFFRASVGRLATQLGVSGFARNRGDGSVEMVFEGAVDAVEQLISYSSDGPEQARVSGVEVTEEEPEGASGFSTG
jgi:acylphosphatase